MNHAERAKSLFKEGYNCSQAVAAAFAEELGMDLNTALLLTSSMGGGMGRLREVCGAVSSMFLMAGLAFGYTDPKDMEAKAAHYARIQKLAAAFKERNGSIVCRELLGETAGTGSRPAERTPAYYKARPCEELVADAAQLLEQMLTEEK